MSPEPSGNQQEPIWTYRGYGLKASGFVSAMAHEFRAEISRATIWRTRIDATTNWAVLVTGASISIAFSQPDTHHGVLILNAFLITLFLFIEARRYRYYQMSSHRVRMMETDFFAAMLAPLFQPSAKWAQDVSQNLLSFNSPISMLEAIGLRLRRNYLWIFLILSIAWLAKYWLFPSPPADLKEFLGRAAIGMVPGSIVVSASLAYFGFLALAAILTLGLNRAPGEVSPRFGMEPGSDVRLKGAHAPGKFEKKRTRFGISQPGQKFLVLIITENAAAVAKRILNELARGVTQIPGERGTVLLCALTANEIMDLKTVVANEDPQAFVNVLLAQEVLGRGFDPLTED